MVYQARLESVSRGNSTVGSNPTLSAIFLRLGKHVLLGSALAQIYSPFDDLFLISIVPA